MEYTLCKEFGWTINELKEQPYNKVQAFIIILNEIAEQEKQKAKELERLTK